MTSQSICSILLWVALFPDLLEGFGTGSFSPIEFFQPHKSPFLQRNVHKRDNAAWYLDASVSDDVDISINPANKFHNDMRRVLELRKNAFCNSSNGSSMSSLSPMDRRNRPALLSDDIDGANRVTSMLRHMVNIGIANEETYQIVLEALCRRGRLRWIDGDSSVVCAADVVDGLIDEVWERQNGVLSTHTCNLALQVYAACSTPRGERRYAEKAQNLLHAMENEGIKPSIESFGHVVNAWAWQQENLGDGECARMAESNLKRMIEENSPDDEMKLQGYDWVLEAWSKSQEVDAPAYADRILNEMKLTKKGNSSLASTLPNSQSYTNAILAWTKSNSTSKAHNLLYEYIEVFEVNNSTADQGPELFAFNSVISAWARLGRTDMAEEVLSKANEIRIKYKTLVPDIFTYNSIVHGYLKDRNPTNGLKKMLKLIDYMERNKVGQPLISPDCFTYHCLLRAWGKSNDENAAENAVQTLKKMHECWESGDTSLKPATAFYNMAINTIAKSRGTVDPQQALKILNLIELSQVCDPDIISYTTVIECFSKSTDPTAAERSLDLFYEAWQIYQEREAPEMMPNLRTYTMVILSLSKASTLENIVKARDLLSQLNDLYSKSKDPKLRPNAYPYNYVLNSAASCVGDAGDKLKAFQIAAQTYNDIRNSDHISPDSYTYAFWFKLCNHLLPEGALRRKSIMYSFEQCKKDGMLSKAALERLLLGTPNDILEDILDLQPRVSSAAYKKMKLSDFPPSWSRNIR
mmetsp:Transcript_16855/g.38929  ORF Transcript_16855/g.38929 Transcript_16855/m.38929 type:complete len:751 (+) Transcript_16855:97-2349(+)